MKIRLVWYSAGLEGCLILGPWVITTLTDENENLVDFYCLKEKNISDLLELFKKKFSISRSLASFALTDIPSRFIPDLKQKYKQISKNKKKMSLPPALLARLAQRGLVNKQKSQKENGKRTYI